MNAPLVSVCVPVYGVEKFIARCARSLFSQTMQDNIEFIFVNDATPDASISVLESVIREFPHRRPQIRIINHDRNRGLAAARVTAVREAKGIYIAHCDSDDWVEPDMYALMSDSAVRNDADIVICNFFEEKAAGPQLVEQDLPTTPEKIVESICKFEIEPRNLAPFLWNRLIRRAFYIDNSFFADERISFCEDLAVTIPMHICSDKVALVEKPLYHYNMTNIGSMTQEKSLKKIESCRLAKENITRFLHNRSADKLLPFIDLRWFFYYLPLITSTECYNPRLWRTLVNPDIKPNLVSRSRISFWLARHRMYTLNHLLNIAVKRLFNK